MMATWICLYSILILAVNTQVFPSVLTRIGGNSVQQGLLLSSFFLLFPFSSVLAGLAADRIGKRVVLIVGAVFLAIPFGITAAVDRLFVRILAVLLFGLGMGTVEGQVSAFLTDIHPGRERSIVNLSQVFFSIGAAGGPFLISLAYRINPGLALSELLWAVTFITVTVMFGFFFLKEESSIEAALDTGGFKKVLHDKEGRLLLLAMFFYVAAEMGTAGWLAKYSEVHLGLSLSISPLSITIFWGGLGLSRALVGFFFKEVRDTHILTAALLLTLAAQMAAFLINMKVASMIFFFFIGVGMGSVWPTLVAIIGARYRESSGSAVGLILAAGGIATPIMHQVIGILSRQDILGLRNTLLGLGIFTLLNLCIVQRIEHEQRRCGELRAVVQNLNGVE